MKSFEGINIYNSFGVESSCIVIDMSGNTLHSWSLKVHKLEYARMCKNGDLLAVHGGGGSLYRLGWHSNIKWRKENMGFHHYIDIAENDDIYGISLRAERISKYGLPLKIFNDYIIALSSDGKIKKKISMFKVLKEEIPLKKLIGASLQPMKLANIMKIVNLKRKPPSFFIKCRDIFHTNTVEIIDRDIAGLCKKGDLLFCVRHLDLIGILDIEKEELIWSWGPGELDRPHHPTLLENGNILIFDNGCRRGYSRIVEIYPLTKDIVWEYKFDPPAQFYSRRLGSCQRLPNGNTLITERDKGHVFEVTYDGDIVWKFYNPEIRKDERKRAAIYRMMRITDPENYPCLESLQ